jgi:hypothetical protein
MDAGIMVAMSAELNQWTSRAQQPPGIIATHSKRFVLIWGCCSLCAKSDELCMNTMAKHNLHLSAAQTMKPHNRGKVEISKYAQQAGQETRNTHKTRL